MIRHRDAALVRADALNMAIKKLSRGAGTARPVISPLLGAMARPTMILIGLSPPRQTSALPA